MQTLQQCKNDISVIIPVYNLERCIRPMLDSLKEQKLGDYKAEIIFVLNNCTDKSEKVIRRYDFDYTIINCTTQGCGPARNAGFDIATGTYIWFMDGDDWLLSDTAIKDVLDKAYAEDLNVLRIPFMSDLFLYQYYAMVWQYLLRREFVQELRFPEYQPAEDDAYMASVLKKNGYDSNSHMSLPCVNKALYYYNYMREGSNMYRVWHGERI